MTDEHLEGIVPTPFGSAHPYNSRPGGEIAAWPDITTCVLLNMLITEDHLLRTCLITGAVIAHASPQRSTKVSMWTVAAPSH